MNILIVDDDAYLLDMLIDKLNELGNSAVGTQSPSTAVHFMQNEKFDVVISDWDFGMFSRTTGGDFLANLHAEWPDVHYVLFSGLRREVPPFATQFLKDGVQNLIDHIDNLKGINDEED